RVPIVLCDLEGKSRQEAARQLGWLPGTLSGRLARARAMLAKRLTRRGLTLSGGVLAVALGQNVASAGVPPSLLASTVKASLLMAAGQAATVSAKVLALAQGVLKTMMITKAKIVTAAVLTLGLSVAGASWSAYHLLAADQEGAAHAVSGETTLVLGPTEVKETISLLAEVVMEDADREQIVGSGKPLTKDLKISDFSSVEIPSIFEVKIPEGDTYHPPITADDNLFDYIKAVKEGST